MSTNTDKIINEVPRALLEQIAEGAEAMGWSSASEIRALLDAPYWRPMTPEDLQRPMGRIESVTLHTDAFRCWPCWNCKGAVTLATRANADGHCPHCQAELDLDDWPVPGRPPQPKDFTELKAAAEACAHLLPLRFMDNASGLYIRNDYGVVFDAHQNRSFPQYMAENKAYAQLVLEATPATVLALLAENDHLRNVMKWRDQALKLLNHQLGQPKADPEAMQQAVEAITRDAERYRRLRERPESTRPLYECKYPVVFMQEALRVPLSRDGQEIHTRYIGPLYGEDLDKVADAARGDA